jgi:hypothetical protein
MFARSLSAGVHVDLSRTGLRWTAEVPLASLAIKQGL